MTGSPHHFPPPGAPVPEQPEGPPAGGAVPGGPAWGTPAPQASPPRPVAPGMLGAAHKPGAIPLRPLTLGSIYDGAFRIIRFNPKATVGAAALVSAISALIPIAATGILAVIADVSLDPANESTSEELTTDQLVGILGSYGALILGGFLSWVGLVFVTGMVANVARAAAVGRRLSLTQAWEATLGKRWRLLGLAAIVGLVVVAAFSAYVAAWVLVVVLEPSWVVVLLWALVSIPAFVAVMWWLWIRVLYLPASVLALEPVGVFGAIGRGYRLTRSQFWRTFGIALLTSLITGVAGYILSVPFSLVGYIAAIALPDLALLMFIVGSSLGTLVQQAFVAPFTAAVTSLQYLDQRMRKEAYDVELMAEAGLIPR